MSAGPPPNMPIPSAENKESTAMLRGYLRSMKSTVPLASLLLAAFTQLTACQSRSYSSNGDEVAKTKASDSANTSTNGKAAADPSADGEAAARKGYTFNLMMPLKLPATDAEWASLASRLARIKALGAYAVSSDVWWSSVESSADNTFAWEPYEKLAEAVVTAKLKWVPILSFHQCGGNVGDECDFKLPDWLWNKYPRAVTQSEFGNSSKEAISVSSSGEALGEYVAFIESFRDRFSRFAPHVSEINVSFGPAGELRYPSYNSHDEGKTGYPSRGGLQAHSDDAEASFRKFVLGKYGTVEAASAAWKVALTKEEDIRPPESSAVLYSTGAHLEPYGRDFFAWYHGSLMERGKLLGEAAIDALLAPSSAFKGVELGAKVPGIHWRMATDRAAELSAGLILPPASQSTAPSAADYEGIAKLFASLDASAKAKGGRFVLHFTCLEMSDDEGGVEAASKAATLVRIVGEAAKKEGLLLKGENALSGTLGSQSSWDNMRRSVLEGPYRGLTILRFDDVLASEVARRNFANLVNDAAALPAPSNN